MNYFINPTVSNTIIENKKYIDKAPLFYEVTKNNDFVPIYNEKDDDSKITKYFNKETFYYTVNTNKLNSYLIEFENDISNPINPNEFNDDLLKIFDNNDFFVSEIKYITNVNNAVKSIFSHIPNKFETSKIDNIINLVNQVKKTVDNKDFIKSYLKVYTNLYDNKKNITDKYIDKYFFGKDLNNIKSENSTPLAYLIGDKYIFISTLHSPNIVNKIKNGEELLENELDNKYVKWDIEELKDFVKNNKCDIEELKLLKELIKNNNKTTPPNNSNYNEYKDFMNNLKSSSQNSENIINEIILLLKNNQQKIKIYTYNNKYIFIPTLYVPEIVNKIKNGVELSKDESNSEYIKMDLSFKLLIELKELNENKEFDIEDLKDLTDYQLSKIYNNNKYFKTSDFNDLTTISKFMLSTIDPNPQIIYPDDKNYNLASEYKDHSPHITEKLKNGIKLTMDDIEEFARNDFDNTKKRIEKINENNNPSPIILDLKIKNDPLPSNIEVKPFVPIIINDNQTPLKSSLKTYIFYNNDTKTSNIIKDVKYDLTKILANFDDIKLIECNFINSIITTEKINELFNNKIYNDFNAVNQIYNTIVELSKNIGNKITETNTKSEKSLEEQRVSAWIRNNYIISNKSESEYRMSASKISELLEVELGIDASEKMSFRNRLSKYLLNVGLQKKRFSDGFYYFGMKNIYESRAKESVKSLEDIMKERNNDFNDYKIKPYISLNNDIYNNDTYISGFDNTFSNYGEINK